MRNTPGFYVQFAPWPFSGDLRHFLVLDDKLYHPNTKSRLNGFFGKINYFVQKSKKKFW